MTREGGTKVSSFRCSFWPAAPCLVVALLFPSSPLSASQEQVPAGPLPEALNAPEIVNKGVQWTARQGGNVGYAWAVEVRNPNEQLLPCTVILQLRSADGVIVHETTRLLSLEGGASAEFTEEGSVIESIARTGDHWTFELDWPGKAESESPGLGVDEGFEDPNREREFAPERDAPGTLEIPPHNRIVTSFTGTGQMSTRPFQVPDGWEMQWASAGGYFGIYLHAANGELVDVAANQSEPGTGSSYQPRGGSYYLSINATGQWHVNVLDLPPPGAQPVEREFPITLSIRHRHFGGAPEAQLVLHKDRIAFREFDEDSHTFTIAASKITQFNQSSINASQFTLHFSEETEAGDRITIGIEDTTTLVILTAYLAEYCPNARNLVR